MDVLEATYQDDENQQHSVLHLVHDTMLPDAKAALADYNKNGGVDWENLKKEVGLK